MDPRIAALQAIYAKVPRLACKGLCGDTCGVVGLSTLEFERIKSYLPGGIPRGDGTTDCPVWDRKTGRCTAYAVRPLICRLWGTAHARDLGPGGWECPHGCEPERWLSAMEFYELLLEAQALDPSLRSLNGEIDRRLRENPEIRSFRITGGLEGTADVYFWGTRRAE